MNEPRVYKNSPFLFIFMLLIFGALFVGLVVAMGRETWYILAPFGLAFGVIFLAVIFSLTSQTIISDEEISTKNLLGTKTLRWTEINQVSGSGHGIKLQDIDRGITVAPSPQLSGYPEVIEWIGEKRSDLFNPAQQGEMSKSWLTILSMLILGVIFIGVGFFAYSRESDTFFPFLIISLVGFGLIGATVFAPQSISFQGSSLVIHYFFSQKTLPANEILAVHLSYTQTRNGKHYFIVLNLANRRGIRLSSFQPSLPIVYLTLKNWHKKSR